MPTTYPIILKIELKESIRTAGTTAFFAALADALEEMGRTWPASSDPRKLFTAAADVTRTTKTLLAVKGK